MRRFERKIRNFMCKNRLLLSLATHLHYRYLLRTLRYKVILIIAKVLRNLLHKNIGIISLDFSKNHLNCMLKRENIWISWNLNDIYNILGIPIYGTYEPEESALIKKMVRKNDVVFDIGANIGWHSMVMSKIVDDRGRVYAFEPVPRSCQEIRENIRLNAIKNVILLEVGIGNISEKGEIYIPKHEGPQFSSTQRIFLGRNDIHEITIRTIDEIVEEQEIGRVDFVKIDVEGDELKVLQGMEKTLPTFMPALLFEYVESWAKRSDFQLKDIFDILLPLGYEIFQMSEDKLKLYKQGGEEQQQRSIIAIHKTKLFQYPDLLIKGK